jgi:glutamine amidotransferase
VLNKKKPFLGICVGMQMLFEKGHEHGIHQGLGWLKGEVIRLTSTGLKIPHMGWNGLNIQKAHPLLSGLETGSHAYFVHSYHATAHSSDLLATVDYGQSLAAVVGQGHIMGTQFHPEKSQQTGLKLLRNFISI